MTHMSASDFVPECLGSINAQARSGTASYTRIADRVSVIGRLELGIESGGDLTEVLLKPPLATVFHKACDVSGFALQSSEEEGEPPLVHVMADPDSGCVALRWLGGSRSEDCYLAFSYQYQISQ